MKAILFLILLFLSTFLCSQETCSGNIIFRRQSQIDSFPITNPGCTEVNGFITITGSDITNIDSLYSIREIKGDLVIRYTTKLKSLRGLSNLENVSLGFILIFNDSLSTIDQFNALKSASYIDIQDNNHLTEIAGFNKVETTGKITLQDHKNLEDINAFHGLNRASDIIITNNKILKSITGFNLGVEYGALRIDKNPVLEKIVGFDKVKKTKSIRIGDNAVKELDGFHELDSIWNSWLQIEDEQFLEIINGFDSLKYCQGLQFSNIYVLSELPKFENLIRVDGPLYIHNANQLKSISAFKNVKIVEGQLRLSSNIELATVDAFQNLDSCYNSVIIEGVNKLKTINGFQKLKYIDESLNIFSAYLEEINGFQLLTEIAGLKNQEVDSNLWVKFQFQAHKLKSLKDLSNLKRVRGISLRGNFELTDISGLDNLDTSYVKFVDMWGNSKLSTCNSKFLCAFFENKEKKAYLRENAPGCNTREEILASCTTVTNEWYTNSTATSVFPNPCPLNSSLWFPGQEADFHLTLYTSTGQKAFEGTVSNPVNLPVNRTGLYHYRLTSDGKQTSGAVVVME
ncbi:MAG: hypothetical protein IPN73_09550 [Saprospiraceae bacterium]|nr:hypothetical protein [Saprospiraceae bacterium]